METNCYDGHCAEDSAQKKTDDLARNIIEQIADKWTILVIDALGTHGEMRFSRRRLSANTAWAQPSGQDLRNLGLGRSSHERNGSGAAAVRSRRPAVRHATVARQRVALDGKVGTTV
jgi:hypothetical protein